MNVSRYLCTCVYMHVGGQRSILGFVSQTLATWFSVYGIYGSVSFAFSFFAGSHCASLAGYVNQASPKLIKVFLLLPPGY